MEYLEKLDTFSVDVESVNFLETFESLLSEISFQNEMAKIDERPDVVEKLSTGECLLAMKHNLDKAIEYWYSSSVPHKESMNYVRKVVALGFVNGINVGMPNRN